MPEPRADLDARLARLEAAVEELRLAVRRIEAAPAPDVASAEAVAPVTSLPEPVAPADSTPPEPPATPERFRLGGNDAGEPALNGEFWLSKLGIGLLLFGVAFLFKYSIEQGWITPAVRLGFGVVLGAVLTTSGLRLHDSQRNLSRVLLGGGIATFFMVGFAASQLYGLVSEPVAFAYMTVVAALAYYLSLREEEALLTVIGTAGALGTPFLLFPRTGSLILLCAYVGCIALWNGVVYVRRGWNPALASAAAGSWIALVGGMVVRERLAPVAGVEQWALEGGMVLAWAVFGVLPVVLLLRTAGSGGGTVAADMDADDEEDDEDLLYVAVLAFVSPLLLVVVSNLVWELPGREWGLGTAALGAAYLAVAYRGRRLHPDLVAVLAVTAATLLTVGFVFALHGDLRFTVLAVEAMALHLLARRGLGRGLTMFGHALFAALAGVFLGRLGARNPLAALFFTGGAEGTGGALAGVGSLADLALPAAALGAALGAPAREGRVYRAAAHLALLLWLWRELAAFPDGTAYASVTWTLYGVALLALARPEWEESRPVAHLVFAVLGAILLRHLADADPLGTLRSPAGGRPHLPVLHARGLADLATVALAFGGSFFLRGPARTAYRLGAHAALLQWIWREFAGVQGGQGIVSALWGIYGVGLLVVATLRGYGFWQGVAKATLLVLLAKMFLVDLRALEALWRVLLFSGLGALFLLLSYYVGRQRQLLAPHRGNG
ncbi:MAG TPA: DUF2339 domain-containing protein [Longimicrobiaceae bacterium]|nr:DUF2339 domain-containing protein [Longimicrobiaceae bacterium]